MMNAAARVIRNRKPSAARPGIEAEMKARGFGNHEPRFSGYREPRIGHIGVSGTKLGLSGTIIGFLGTKTRVIRNANRRVFRNPAFGLSGTLGR